jgi:poly-beta-1,6-N-acetyl-D-glucosamine synthase
MEIGGLLMWILVGIYAVFFGWLWAGWRKNIPLTKGQAPMPSISVVVAFRNEAQQLPVLLKSLRQIDVEGLEVELILVDDGSDDAGPDIISLHTQGFPYPAQMIQSQGIGKKAALTTGIHAAQGEVIVTTDADCTFSPRWLQQIAGYYTHQEVQLVAAPVAYCAGTFGGRLLAIELHMLMGIAAACIAHRMPTMANGANFSFRKQLFITLHGYQNHLHLPSGDDEFFLHRAASHAPQGLRYAVHPDALVSSEPPQTFRQFVHQRLRWAGKWGNYTTMFPKLLGGFVFTFNLMWISAIGLLMAKGDTFFILGAGVVSKWLIETLFLYVTKSLSHRQPSLLETLVVSMGYPFYTVLFGLSARVGSFQWKGRKYP